MASLAAGFPRLSRQSYLFIGAGLLLAVAFGLLGMRIDFTAVHAWVERANGFAVFLAMALLPLIGFPVVPLHAAAGIRFGIAGGMAISAAALVVHLVASYWLVRLLPGFFSRRLNFLKQRLPPTTHRAAACFTLLMPGAPYFAQNYLVPLIGAPLGTFFAIGFPLHLGRSVISIMAGDMSDQLTPGRVVFLFVYATVLMCAWGFAYCRLRKQLRALSPGAGGPRQRG